MRSRTWKDQSFENFRRIAELWRFERDEYHVDISVRQPLVLIALVVSLIWYLFEPTGVSIMCIVMLGGLVGVSFIWVRVVAANSVSRRSLLYAAFQVGDELEEQITLENRSGLPLLWAEFIDRSDFPDYRLSVVNSVNSFSTYQWRERAHCSIRGVFFLGPWELILGDPFGIFQARQVYLQSTEVLVYPPLAALPENLLPRSKQTGDISTLNQALSAETINAATTRPFTPGDPLRHIHWRTSARRDELHARVFQPEASTAIWILLDVQDAVQAGQGINSTLETLVILAATLSDQLLDKRFAVGILGAAGEPEVILPQRGKSHLWRILRFLAQIKEEEISLAERLEQVRPLVSERDTLLILTPSLQRDWARYLPHLTRGRFENNIEIILLDPAAYGGSGGVNQFKTILAKSGVAARVLQHSDVRPNLETYGKLRRWEFVTLGTGRVIARQTPRQYTSLSRPTIDRGL